ncbi:hypothetical protein [Ruegeria jejuensis]|uniref:hypothetical protein n=1 Tax=Ruegeria jejuensis TaxID=3233338 RepID=UPI00355B7AEA
MREEADALVCVSEVRNRVIRLARKTPSAVQHFAAISIVIVVPKREESHVNHLLELNRRFTAPEAASRISEQSCSIIRQVRGAHGLSAFNGPAAGIASRHEQ